ncbi:MAG: phosphoribosylglycinamide formyltransferase [Pirellulaceae bacterium]|nr:phosphoribosylglycinamide formyltransferase [Pirellulaceae bacterium]
MNHTVLPIAVFLSGGGRTLENLLEHRDRYGLPIDVRLVVSSSSKVRGLSIAREAGIETLVVRKSEYPDPNEYSDAMFGPVRKCGAELVVMAGFLKHVLIPPDFDRRVVNIHPSLLPAFGGEGMYGLRVHQAVIDAGVLVSGCTVHYVDNHYDQGPIILQKECLVVGRDTPEMLADRIFEQECEALPEAIRMICEG